ncbi:MAG: hypothetical protein ACRCZF_15590 [Gemmataceae bacterium]
MDRPIRTPKEQVFIDVRPQTDKELDEFHTILRSIDGGNERTIQQTKVGAVV